VEVEEVLRVRTVDLLAGPAVQVEVVVLVMLVVQELPVKVAMVEAVQVLQLEQAAAVLV
jgi:hypothetical protein